MSSIVNLLEEEFSMSDTVSRLARELGLSEEAVRRGYMVVVVAGDTEIEVIQKIDDLDTPKNRKAEADFDWLD